MVKIEKNKKIELNIDCPDSTTKVDINTIYFDHIIGNLFENAVKFNNNDTVKIDIKISNPKDGFVTVSFSDNGIGIPAEDYEKVFDKFYQVEKNFTGQVEGAGLGLPLVRMAIESAGGQINVTSELEKGTTFEFTLPTA